MGLLNASTTENPFLVQITWNYSSIGGGGWGSNGVISQNWRNVFFIFCKIYLVLTWSMDACSKRLAFSVYRESGFGLRMALQLETRFGDKILGFSIGRGLGAKRVNKGLRKGLERLRKVKKG